MPQANAAFFQDFARPRTITRFRYDRDNDLMFPDRSEYFWARESLNSPYPQGGKGPKQPKAFPAHPKPGYHGPTIAPKGERSLNYDELSLYTEAAAGNASFFVEVPYLSTNPYYTGHHAGFANMNLGTKSVLFDCELLQITFQFRTYLPTGNAVEGLGNGHVSLEPSLLMALRLAPDWYLQGQVAEWIPLGGDQNYAGSLIHYHTSLNGVLGRIAPNSPLIGTFEFNGWSFQDGAYTDPVLGPFRKSSGSTYANLGPGLRMVLCDKVDFGVAAAFALTDPHWASSFIRAEFRVLY